MKSKVWHRKILPWLFMFLLCPVDTDSHEDKEGVLEEIVVKGRKLNLASGGLGFHSNDARGVTISVDPVSGEPIDPVDPLVRSAGREIGFRTIWLDDWNASLATWSLEADFAWTDAKYSKAPPC